jgi:uncharacterized protein (DUF1697 family)
VTACIALIRGINVGRAKRIAMADLRRMVEGLGHDNVRTLLNSGNVVFEATRPRMSKLAEAMEAGIARTFGISARVVVVAASDLTTIIDENPLRAVAGDPARYMVAFVASPSTLTRAKSLLDEAWTPEAFAIGAKAAYLWCANGVADSKLAKAFARAVGDAATMRNWATVLKLIAATQDA